MGRVCVACSSNKNLGKKCNRKPQTKLDIKLTESKKDIQSNWTLEILPITARRRDVCCANTVDMDIYFRKEIIKLLKYDKLKYEKCKKRRKHCEMHSTGEVDITFFEYSSNILFLSDWWFFLLTECSQKVFSIADSLIFALKMCFSAIKADLKFKTFSTLKKTKMFLKDHGSSR